MPSTIRVCKKELESTKAQLQESLSEAERKLSEMHIDANKLKSAFNKAKRMLKDGTLKNRKAIVQQYVKEVIIYKNKILVEYNISGTYTVKEELIKTAKNNDNLDVF